MDSRRTVRYIRAGAPAAPAADTVASSTVSLPELDVVQTVLDDAEAGRPRLAVALEPIAAGDASVLLVPSLRTVAGSLRELVGVVDWLDVAGAALVTEDTGLDSTSSAGRASVALLREIASWDDAPGPDRPRRGRPSLSRLSPELVDRIGELRATGMSLQAVADQLNAEGVPTPRGGTRWRPSSVQSALGYRRPRPPMPGIPPVPPGPPGSNVPPGPPVPPVPPGLPGSPVPGPRSPGPLSQPDRPPRPRHLPRPRPKP